MSTCRAYTFGGAAEIPWSAIDQWARRHGIAGDEFDELVTVIRAMDRTWLELMRKAEDD